MALVGIKRDVSPNHLTRRQEVLGCLLVLFDLIGGSVFGIFMNDGLPKLLAALVGILWMTVFLGLCGFGIWLGVRVVGVAIALTREAINRDWKKTVLIGLLILFDLAAGSALGLFFGTGHPTLMGEGRPRWQNALTGIALMTVAIFYVGLVLVSVSRSIKKHSLQRH